MKNKGIEMNQTATETTEMPTTLTLIDPTLENTAEVIRRAHSDGPGRATEPPGSSRETGRTKAQQFPLRLRLAGRFG